MYKFCLKFMLDICKNIFIFINKIYVYCDFDKVHMNFIITNKVSIKFIALFLLYPTSRLNIP